MNLPWLRSLRVQLAASYVATLMLALVIFGSIAVVLIDRELRSSLDDRLENTTHASQNFVGVRKGAVEVEKDDREQLLAVLSPQTNLVVIGNDSQLAFSSVVQTYPELVRVAHLPEGFLTVRHGSTVMRVSLLPISADGVRMGTIAAWASTEWIEETDQRVEIAFAVAALLLGIVASLTATAATRRALADAFQRQHRFTANASHELRAPLSVIRAEADLALRKPRAPSDYRSALGTIAFEADQMDRLVDALLTAARAEDGRGERTIFDLSSLARRACSRLTPAAAAKQVTISLAQAERCDILGDAGALEQAVMAVLHNAIKYVNSGGSIDVRAARRRRAVELCIQDDGFGFSPEALIQGTEPFWRDDANRGGRGTGLGLAIASRVVHAGGGRMALTNAAEGGARVQMWFRCAERTGRRR